MKKNVGAVDGFLRTLFFLVALCYAIVAGGVAAWVLVGVAAVLFATSVIMWCPLYEMIGVDSNGKEDTV